MSETTYLFELLMLLLSTMIFLLGYLTKRWLTGIERSIDKLCHETQKQIETLREDTKADIECLREDTEKDLELLRKDNEKDHDNFWKRIYHHKHGENGSVAVPGN